MLRIKICGITRSADALAAVASGADALGLNFYRDSPRSIEPQAARQLVHALPAEVVKVGVFVNESAAVIRRLAAEIPLDAVQLHGDEPPALVAELAGLPVIKAFRLGDEGLAPLAAFLDEAARLGRPPRMVLLDASRPGQYGGTGHTVDWALAAGYHKLGGERPPLVLAGGLVPGNVAAAIRAVRPQAVDTASGVERVPGEKDIEKLREFIAQARASLFET